MTKNAKARVAFMGLMERDGFIGCNVKCKTIFKNYLVN